MNWLEILSNARIRGSFSDEEYKLAASLLNDPIADKGRKLLGEQFEYKLHSRWDYLSDQFFKAVKENDPTFASIMFNHIESLTDNPEERNKCILDKCENELAHRAKVFIDPEGAYVSESRQKNVKYWEITHKEIKPLMIPEPPQQFFTKNTHHTAFEETVAINKKQEELGLPPITYHPFVEDPNYGHRALQQENFERKKEKDAKHIPIEILKVNQALKVLKEDDESFDHLATRTRAAVSNFLKNSHWELTTRSFPEEQVMRIYRSK